MKLCELSTELRRQVAVKITSLGDGQENCLPNLEQLADQLNLAIVKNGDDQQNYSFLLLDDSGCLALQDTAAPKTSPVAVDFVSGKANHRRQYGGGQGQMIAKAVGVSSRFHPHVLDATAGMGGDAFVLSSLNCRMTMVERHPIVAALLADGLFRAQTCDVAEIRQIAVRMSLLSDNSVNFLGGDEVRELAPDVVYLDPMFPERKKKAAVKKEMQFFHKLVGADDDQDQLLKRALDIAHYRVVVKRPRIAPPIGGLEPSYQLSGKTSRYDIYALKKIPT